MKKIHILLVVLTALVVWHKILNQSLLGEGYYYFSSEQNFIGPGTINERLLAYDNLARIIFDLIPAIFKGKIVLYLAFQLLLMTLLYIAYYLTVDSITKSKRIALFSTLFFLSSFIGSYQMMGIGNYQRFVQRVPNLFFLLASLVFLNKYLLEERRKKLQYSLILYSLGMFLAHYSFYFASIFVIYPAIYSLLNKKGKQKLKGVFTGLAYLLVGYAIISFDQFANVGSAVEIFSKPINSLQQVLIQFVTVSVPYGLLKIYFFATHAKYPYTQSTLYLSIPVIVAYSIASLTLIKRKKQLSAFFVACFLSLFPIFYMNLMSGRVDVLTSFGQDRYLLYPSILTSLMWAIVIFEVLPRKKFISFLFSIILLAYITHNTYLIWVNIEEDLPKSIAMNQYVNYIYQLEPQLTSKDTVIVPSSLIWPEPLFDYLYKNDVKFVAYEEGWEEDYIDNKQNVFVIDYNKQDEIIIDRTEEFRSGAPIKFTVN